MKKLIFILLLALALTSCEKEEEVMTYKPTIMVNDKLYATTLEACEVEAFEKSGRITSSINSSKAPEVNDQSNFGSGFDYDIKDDVRVDILLDGKCTIFANSDKPTITYLRSYEDKGYTHHIYLFNSFGFEFENMSIISKLYRKESWGEGNIDVIPIETSGFYLDLFYSNDDYHTAIKITNNPNIANYTLLSIDHDDKDFMISSLESKQDSQYIKANEEIPMALFMFKKGEAQKEYTMSGSLRNHDDIDADGAAYYAITFE